MPNRRSILLQGVTSGLAVALTFMLLAVADAMPGRGGISRWGIYLLCMISLQRLLDGGFALIRVLRRPKIASH